MSEFNPIREIPKPHDYGPNDTLVVFGELFNRGYANGVVDEAKKAGMNVIYSTVGRRDADQNLRALNSEELAEKDQPLINIPLEAGFDLEKGDDEVSPVEQLKAYGLRDWEDAKLNWASIEQAREKGRVRFRNSVTEWVNELKPQLKEGGKVVFLHTMAGGFPRAKVVMPIANKVFKGIGDRYLSSKKFWDCEIGRLCDMSFNEVTAETFAVLIELTQDIPNSRYLAFGYHGNEVMTGDEFKWYSYSPYLQGWAKLLLEERAAEATKKGAKACVYNVPEILTNSSSIFLGIEVVIYPLLRALIKLDPDHPLTVRLKTECETKLNDDATFDDIDRISQEFLNNPEVQAWPKYEGWPQHNGPEQMRHMREASEAIINLHKSKKDLMTGALSELVFRSCGIVMLRDSVAPGSYASWLGHDLVAKTGFAELS